MNKDLRCLVHTLRLSTENVWARLRGLIGLPQPRISVPHRVFMNVDYRLGSALRNNYKVQSRLCITDVQVMVSANAIQFRLTQIYDAHSQLSQHDPRVFKPLFHAWSCRSLQPRLGRNSLAQELSASAHPFAMDFRPSRCAATEIDWINISL